MPHPPGAPSRLPPCDLTGNKSCLERVCSLTDRPLRGPRRLRRRSRDQAGSACSARTGSRLLRAYLVGADPTVRVTTYGGCSMRAGIDEYQFGASVSLPTFLPNEAAASSKDRVGPSREAPAMPVPSEPFAAVYEDRNRLGVIVARTGRGGFEAYAADDHSLGLFPTPRAAAAAITMARPWIERRSANAGPS
jgi:hypothetical protein